MSREERIAWRDVELSRRHKLYGFNCPATDIDLLLIEYNHERAIAVIEYKARVRVDDLNDLDFSGPNYGAVRDLCDRARIGFFVCFYEPDFSAWRPLAQNKIARIAVPEDKILTENEFVRLLYRLRGGDPPRQFLNGEQGIVPEPFVLAKRVEMLPTGDYNLRVEEIEIARSSHGSDLYVLRFSVSDRPGVLLTDRLTDHPTAVARLDAFLIACGVDVAEGEPYEFRKDLALKTGVRWINPVGLKCAAFVECNIIETYYVI